MQETALAADMPKHLVSVKWDKPGSRFDGVVHSVPFELVDYTEEKGRVIVWWPKRTGEKKWDNGQQPWSRLNLRWPLSPVDSGSVWNFSPDVFSRQVLAGELSFSCSVLEQTGWAVCVSSSITLSTVFSWDVAGRWAQLLKRVSRKLVLCKIRKTSGWAWKMLICQINQLLP